MRVFFGILFISFVSIASAQKLSIDDIYEPVVVGIPPSDAYIGLSKLPDGTIRHYNYGEQAVSEAPYCVESADSGMSWKRVGLSRDMIYGDVRSPLSGEYIRAFTSGGRVYVMRSEGGIDGGRVVKMIDDTLAIMLRPVVFVDGGKRAVISGHRTDRSGCFTYVSTDDGRSWVKSNKVNVPKHTKDGFHLGVRWNHGAVEPTVAEIGDGRLWMIIRTAQDRHYQSFSNDGALTWSEPTESPFYGTITMPTLYKMEDGRLLFFWSNTTPLPEMATANGVWDDVFTNRSATHVAISEDTGVTWMGFRELLLDDRRNEGDFATSKGVDKSVHQAQCIEVAPGKILASLGQNQLHRKMVVFDVDWLYEKGRRSSFEDGLNSWSTFKYYKGIVGHCGYNRKQGGRLVQHPDKEGSVLNIRYEKDDSLVCDNDGAVWNFPALKNGSVKAVIKLPKEAKSVDMLLNDRWFNPSDTVAKYNCIYKVELNRKNLKINDDKWHTVEVKWSKDGKAILFVDNKKRVTLPLVNRSQHGISYLHFISGNVSDDVGIFVESVEASE